MEHAGAEERATTTHDSHAAPSAASNVSVVLFCEPARPESMFYRQDTTVSSLERLGEAGWLPDVRSEES